jgi:hypothetical protein
MKSIILRKSIIVLIILTPLFTDLACKKQAKCGCGKDVIFEISDESMNNKAYVYYSESSKTAYFYPELSSTSPYYFCNPGRWIDTLKNNKYDSGKLLLVTGKVYYDCTYLMNSGNNYGGYSPPVYQVDVTDLKEDNYAKK